MKIQVVVSMFGEFMSPTSEKLQDWWNEMEMWATDLKVPPNEISGVFRQKPKGLISHNGYKLHRYRRRFAVQLKEKNIEGLELMQVCSEERYKMFDWDFLGVYGPDHPAGTSFIVGISKDRLREVPHYSSAIFCEEVARRSRSYLSLKYGFAVAMPKDFMPGGYAFGIATTMPEELMYDANAWAHYSNHKPWRAECDKTLRNVYGYNVLSAKHLNIYIGDQRLEDWIITSSGRGRVEPLDKGLFLWTFQEGSDKEAFLSWDYPPVVRAREELKQYKIFPWQKLVR